VKRVSGLAALLPFIVSSTPTMFATRRSYGYNPNAFCSSEDKWIGVKKRRRTSKRVRAKRHAKRHAKVVAWKGAR